MFKALHVRHFWTLSIVQLAETESKPKQALHQSAPSARSYRRLQGLNYSVLILAVSLVKGP